MAKEQTLLNYFQDNESLIVLYSSIKELVLFIDMFLSNGERTVLKSVNKRTCHILMKYFDTGTSNMFMVYFDYREFIMKTQLFTCTCCWCTRDVHIILIILDVFCLINKLNPLFLISQSQTFPYTNSKYNMINNIVRYQ